MKCCFEVGTIPGGLRISSPFQFCLVTGHRRSNGGSTGRQTETVQNLADGVGGLDRGENPEAAAATGTFQHVDGEHPTHQLGPGIVVPPGKGLRDGLFGCRRVGTIRISGIVVGKGGNDLGTPCRGRGKHAVIADQVKAGWGH